MINEEECLEIVRERLVDRGYHLLYLVVSGSHAWGLERPDSDIDLRGIYQKPTMDILKLSKGKDTIEFSDGLYDVQLYEIEKFLAMLCNNNGNMVNLLWLPHPLYTSFTVPWARLSRDFLTRKLRLYYRGYAESQKKRAMSQRGGKALIYTYREMFSGLYALHYGKIEHNFMQLWGKARQNNWYRGTLLDKYFPNPSQEVTDEGWHKFYSEWGDLCLVLDKIAQASPLPESYDGRQKCSDLLLGLRITELFLRGMNRLT